MTLRRATEADAPAMVRNVIDGFASFSAWAPPSYVPPRADVEAERLRERFGWAGFAAHCTPDVTAHVTSFTAPDEPATTHLFQLFLQPHRQGTGVAKELLDLALADALRNGTQAMRLLTPAGNARGLAFYVREGFQLDGEPFLEPALGIELVRLRRAL